MSGTAQPDLGLQARFWNRRAADYPAARSPGHRARQARRFARLPAAAQPAPGVEILDVGAGAGALALFAADAGATVTALDVSEAMLARLREAAKPRPIATVLADWRSFDPASAGFRHAFDVVYAQMVPSFRSIADFARLEDCSRRWCVFIGWGRARRDPWLQAAFAAHDVPWEVPAGVPLATELLARLGRDPRPSYWKETWSRTRSAAAALRDAADHLFVRGVDADFALLRRELTRIGGAEQLVDRSVVEIGMLAWAVDTGHMPELRQEV
jgi:SAM-dependent methyltransferase